MSPAITSTSLLSTITAVCRIHPVTLAYLFGSHARATADAESDIDVAVLAAPHLSALDRAELRLRLMRDLADALQLPLEKMDVVVLQDVPTLLQFNVIRTGMVVFGDVATRQAFTLAVEQRYDDEVPFLNREADLTLDRILAHHS